ncbi:MAG: hypothetical protein R3F11_28285 [Verrucomicrobiales bacterium]
MPDAEKAMRLYASEPNRLFDLMPKYHGKSYQTAAEVVNEIFHADRMNRHCFGWDFETLARRLREAGFNQIEGWNAGNRSTPNSLRTILGGLPSRSTSTPSNSANPCVSS